MIWAMFASLEIPLIQSVATCALVISPLPGWLILWRRVFVRSGRFSLGAMAILIAGYAALFAMYPAILRVFFT